MCEYLRKIAAELAPRKEAARARLHPDVRRVIGGEGWIDLHIPLLDHLLDGTGLSKLDPDYLPSLLRGRNVAGRLQVSPFFRSKQRSPECSVHEVIANAMDFENDAMIDRVLPSPHGARNPLTGTRDNVLYLRSWDKTTKEFLSGSLAGPFASRDDIPFSSYVIWPRFPIWERHGGADWKVRNIDDGLASHINETVESTDTYIPDAVPELSSLIRAFADAFPGEPLALWIADFLSAYRQSPACPYEANLRVIATWDPVSSKVVFGYHRAQPFGAAAAPQNYARDPDMMARLAATLFSALVLHCVDDAFSVEREATAASARFAWLLLAELIGWQVAMDKCPHAARQQVIVGVLFDLSSEKMLLRCIPSRVASLRDTIDEALIAGRFHPGEAARFRGKLVFAASQMWGRAPLALLRPLNLWITRHEGATPVIRARGRASPDRLGPALRACLQWWADRLRRHRPRELLCYAELDTVFTFSDGEGSGHVAVAVWPSAGDPRITYDDVPDWITYVWKDRLTQITNIEAVCPLLALGTWPELFSNKLWIHWTDNQGALSALIGGSAGVCDLNHISFTTWDTAEKLNAIPWFEYVRSKSNPLDGPSRGDLSLLPSILPPGATWQHDKPVWRLFIPGRELARALAPLSSPLSEAAR